MPTAGDEDLDHAEQLVAHADRNKEAWGRTLDDMTAMADEREAAGWDAVRIMAGHTAPEPPDAGVEDRFGLSYVVPGNQADPFLEAYEAGQYPLYEVYRGSTETRTFLVTELLDPDAERAIYITGNYRRLDARGLLRAAHRAGKMYSHLQTLDKTHLGSFEHDGYEKFFAERDLEWLETDAFDADET